MPTTKTKNHAVIIDYRHCAKDDEYLKTTAITPVLRNHKK